jgi:Asp-tRNA(Asn)/Glu-tRNA(Gln) amidotransferase A subunit family amidase
VTLSNAPAASLAALAAGLAKRQYSSVELTREALSRIERSQPVLNAMVTVTAEAALAAAAVADQRLASGKGGPLTGVPMIHKDIFCTAGVLTTCGSRMLSNFVSPYDATVVAKLKEAGTVMLGKANMDEFAMGSSNESPTPGTGPAYPAAPLADRPRRSPRAWCRWQQLPIPEALSASRQRCVASPASSRRMAAFRATG